MRKSLVLSKRLCGRALPKLAAIAVAIVATVSWGSTASGADAPFTSAAAAKHAKKKPSAAPPEAAPITLPNGHIGQEYGTKILGVTGIDIGDATCSPVVGLPRGLELNCDKMTVHGQPLETVDRATVSFTVSDSEGHAVPLEFELSVVDGMDVVRVGGSSQVRTDRAKLAPVPAPVSPSTARSASPAAHAESVASAAPATSTAPVTAPKRVAATTPAIHRAVSAPGPSDHQPAMQSSVKASLTLPGADEPAAPIASAEAGAGVGEGMSRSSPDTGITSQTPLREGLQTISGSCFVSDADTAAGIVPLVSIQVREPSADKTEWSTVDLVPAATPGPPVTIAGRACTYTVTLKNPLAAGERVRLVLTAPAGKHFGTDPQDVSILRAEDAVGKKVYTALAVAPPVITSPVLATGTRLAGSATPSPAGGPVVNVAAISDDDYEDLNADGSPKTLQACVTADELKKDSGRFLQLTGNTVFAPTDATGNFSATLADPLAEGQRFHLVQMFPAHSELTETEKRECKTTVSVVKGDLDWGRIHADFTAGVLISNDSQNTAAGTPGAGDFSQAHQFFALNVEKSWTLPGCYLRVFARRQAMVVDEHGKMVPDATAPFGKDGDRQEQCFDWEHRKLVAAKWSQHFKPGINTYFQTRLTAIPVSTVAMDGSATPNSANILQSAQTARVEVGAYFPYLITRWDYDHHPNALFIAPLAKVGFDTVTGASSVTTIAANNTVSTQSFEQVYNYWSYGARVGHMELARSETKAPETFSYLDISVGPYSNLQSYICHGSDTASTVSNSECSAYTDIKTATDSRKRLYRLDIEGLLKIPKTAFYVGLNANIGQKTFGATHLDRGLAAPDDIRFFFGTKFDIAAVLTKFKLTPQ